MIKIYGSIISPYVRKVLTVLEFKGLSYEIHNKNPYMAKDREQLLKMSPLGKIPVYKDEYITFPDSSVICAYIEKKYPKNLLYPNNPECYDKSLWYEEYADSYLISISRAIFKND